MALSEFFFAFDYSYCFHIITTRIHVYVVAIKGSQLIFVGNFEKLNGF